MQIAQLIRDYITVLAKERGLDRRRKSVGFDPSTKGSSDVAPPGGINPSTLLSKTSIHPPLPPPRPSLSARQQHLIALNKVQQQTQFAQDQMYGNVYGTQRQAQPSPSPSMVSNQSMMTNSQANMMNQSNSNSSLYGTHGIGQNQITGGGQAHSMHHSQVHPMRQVQIVRPSPQSPAGNNFPSGQSPGVGQQQPFQRTHRRGVAFSVPQYQQRTGPGIRMTDPEIV